MGQKPSLDLSVMETFPSQQSDVPQRFFLWQQLFLISLVTHYFITFSVYKIITE